MRWASLIRQRIPTRLDVLSRPLPPPPSLQLQSKLCNGGQPGAGTDLGALAPQVEQLLGSGLAGLGQQLDGLLGTNGTIQVRAGRHCFSDPASLLAQPSMLRTPTHLLPTARPTHNMALPSPPPTIALSRRAWWLAWPTAA